MKFKSVEIKEDDKPAYSGVRVSMGRRERNTLGKVLHGTTRRTMAINPGENTWSLDVAVKRDLVCDTWAGARFGILRTIMTVAEVTLADLQVELAGYTDIGIRDELYANPTADPVDVAKVAQHAGKMAASIDNYFEAEA